MVRKFVLSYIYLESLQVYNLAFSFFFGILRRGWNILVGYSIFGPAPFNFRISLLCTVFVIEHFAVSFEDEGLSLIILDVDDDSCVDLGLEYTVFGLYGD